MKHLYFVYPIRLLAFAMLLITSQAFGTVTPGDTIHAVKYVIELQEVDMSARTIRANTTVTLTPLIDNLDVYQLQLMVLTVDSVFVDQEKIAAFTHENDILNIPLPGSVSTGDTSMVEVYYHGQPFHEDWGGFHYSGDYAFNLGVGISWIPHNLGKTWFPCIDDFTDRALYELIATVPDTMTAIGGGELIEVVNNSNGTHSFHWVLDNPIPTYLASVAIGEYALVEDTYSGVERDIPINYYVKYSDTNQVAGSFSRIHEILALYENHFGPYDWYRVGYVGTAIGAMEHATNIAYPHFCINGNSGYEDLYAHELSHMWFGDKVTCDKAEEMWINEGWATFCQHYYVEVLDGVEPFKNAMREMHEGVLRSCHSQEGGYHPLNNIPQEYTYGTSAYDRGATVVQALRAYLGDDVFFDACRSYLDELAFTSVSSYDMEASFTANTGIDMSGFFNNWVYHGGTPHYSIDSFNYVPSGNNYDVTIYLKQKRHGPAFVGDGNIIGFNVTDANWVDYQGIAQFDGATGSATITIPEEPATVFLDLWADYMDATIDNINMIDEPDEYSFSNTLFSMEVTELSGPAFIQATHNFAPPDTMTTPVPDLRLSDYRYWTVRGVIPETFDATGRFFYSRSGLDNTLIQSATDSVAIFYRENAGMEWIPMDFTVVGTWSIGYIYVENMPMGEYALGVYDISVSTEEAFLDEDANGGIHIFPNPSGDHFTIAICDSRADQLLIYDLQGKLVENMLIDGAESMIWTPAEQTFGTYIAVLKEFNGHVLGTEKLIYTR